MAKAKRKKTMQSEPAVGNLKTELGSQMVDNPYFSRDHDVGGTNPRKTAVVVNIRESAVSVLASKGQLDKAQVAAADEFRRLFERMGGSGARSIDWRKEAVDGGRFPDPIGSQQIDAGKKLAAAYEAINRQHGLYGWRLLGYICGEGRSVHELTETRRQRDTMTDLLRMYLTTLSEHWGYSSRAHRAVQK